MLLVQQIHYYIRTSNINAPLQVKAINSGVDFYLWRRILGRERRLRQERQQIRAKG
jgi:hypothetical protein